MKIIEYIGDKPYKEDNVAGTGCVWNGKGDTCEVPDRAVQLLLQHPQVWKLVGLDGPRFELKVGAGEKVQRFNLDIMNDQELRAICRMHGLKANLQRRGDDLRAEMVRLNPDEAPPPAPPPAEAPPPSDPAAAPPPVEPPAPPEAPPLPPIPEAPAPAVRPQANTKPTGKRKG